MIQANALLTATLTVTFIALTSLVGCLKNSSNETSKKIDKTVILESALNWQPFTEADLKENLGKKPIIIYFWAEWCAPCHQLRKLTFVNTEVTSKIKDYALFKIDATDQENSDVVKFQDKYKVESLPVVIFYNAKGELKEALTLRGFEPPMDFILRLQKL